MLVKERLLFPGQIQCERATAPTPVALSYAHNRATIPIVRSRVFARPLAGRLLERRRLAGRGPPLAVGGSPRTESHLDRRKPLMNGRERVLAHLEGRPIDQLPVMPITMQFACDLIGATYRQYETDYTVLAEGQLRVAEQFDFDYVNTMSDPGREAADCGAVLEYFENSPAALIEEQALLSDKADLVRLKIPDPLSGGRMSNSLKAIALLRERVRRDKIVEGWIEGPMAQGADLRGINRVMLDFYDDPEFVRDLFDFALVMELRFARAQVDAGVDLIGVGDAAASLIGPELYREFVWPFEKRLIDGLHAIGARARLHICGNTRFALKEIALLGCEIVDLDFLSPVSQGRAEMGADQVILGNVNPVLIVRNGTPEDVHRVIAECHQQAGPRFIVGPGCEIPRDTPHENVLAFAEYARAHKFNGIH
jgi:MtaA/CmuA family methyltransferase